jgi:hypothetical protein
MTQKVMTQNKFFAIFHTFIRGTTDLCLPFVENVKSQKSTHPTVQNKKILK